MAPNGIREIRYASSLFSNASTPLGRKLGESENFGF